MNNIKVFKQTELDVIPDDYSGEIVVLGNVSLSKNFPNAHVVARESSHVVARESSSVEARRERRE